MLRRPKREIKGEKTIQNRDLRAFTIFNLVDVLDELKGQGNYYLKEWVRMGENEEIIALQMVFIHFLTGERKYLYVRKETMPYGEEMVMWISDRSDYLDDSFRANSWMDGEESVLKDVLQEMELIPIQGELQKVSVESLRKQERTSLFSLLYDLGYRQLREGWGKEEKNSYGEESQIWIGEFTGQSILMQDYQYLYLVLRNRKYEQWESIYGDDMTCVWRETEVDMYMTRSNLPLEGISIEGENLITLSEIHGMEAIKTYLDAFTKVDGILAQQKNGKE